VPRWLARAGAISGRLLLLGAVVWAAANLVARMWLLFLPLAGALLLASVLTPPVRWLAAHRVPRGAASFLVVLLGVGLLVGAFALIVPQVVQQVSERSGELGGKLDAMLQGVRERLPGGGGGALQDPKAQAGKMLQERGGALMGGVALGAAKLLEGAAGVLLALVVLFFLLRDGPQMMRWLLTRAVPERRRAEAQAVAERAWTTLQHYVRGIALIALFDAVGIGVGLLLIGVPLALAIALLTFFTAFIPVIGATVAGGVAVLVALLTGGLRDALLALGVVVAVQQLEGNVLEPYIMGKQVPLHPVAVLVALTAGTLLAGIPGALLSVPLAAVLSAAGNELRKRHATA
jgi:predicted PurR-regulated permease PerM